MIFGAILAGGKGTRMGIDKPKQFLMLGNKPIIIHTIEKFLVCDRIDKVFVGVHPDWVDYTEDLIGRYIHTDKALSIVPGGKDRNGTIFNIVDQIESEYGENDSHIIVTHDSVRPFVTLRIIEENIDAALQYGACDTVVNAVDTIVASDDGNMISEIPDRRTMFQGQTPQSFNMSLLKKMYLDLNDGEKEILTDACKICVVRDIPVKLVRGETSNIKITTIDDMKIAKAMI
ncbi:2-C-methyl-D-erythritol 4-phosphate cytidylyltransferase [Lachnoclostridium sp. An169]|uniref:IspD/TarI family cytidylyltransferase n=1 Tax=Lachnoclostridium sp. An169 TaxID=1965569 RepID=UPI000B388004|nr:2-C-methyl-D-erythritol 4-phosphate cytidylyltransferase [Lachnoclostridium sp. An169]OUP86537.1 2-C-methyl-D-erythritol 4-phosphate cytidylyltransferase [Lachnoclostridium sp. An169]HJA65281.1 2-C-methyl-D-erythritol 4-phosphate cytidylyltransferase [Candidatus Mediterraneibacter cottocaccae]